MKAEELYQIQVAYYKGNEEKAYASLAPHIQEVLEKPLSVQRRQLLNEYYTKVRDLTEESIPLVPDSHLRSSDYHIDHIVPISYGFTHGIPVELMAGVDNLQVLSARENVLKNKHITDKALDLLSSWGYSD